MNFSPPSLSAVEIQNEILCFLVLYFQWFVFLGSSRGFFKFLPNSDVLIYHLFVSSVASNVLTELKSLIFYFEVNQQFSRIEMKDFCMKYYCCLCPSANRKPVADINCSTVIITNPNLLCTCFMSLICWVFLKAVKLFA